MPLSIVIPVYREEDNIPRFLATLRPILTEIGEAYELIFCLDPSPVGSEQVILKAREEDPRVKLLTFSRRFGQPMATLAGLQYSRGDAVIVMDVDLQDPPELLHAMVAKWREGYEILRLRECHGFLRGLVAVVGFRQVLLPFDRPPRAVGKTHYNRYLGSLRIGFNGIFCFSTYALALSTVTGFTIAGFSLLLTAVYFTYKLMGWEIVWGNPTLVILVSFLGGIQLISVGILGEYIGRIYEEVRARPKFIVDRQVGFDA
jgi:dolichol-phosphate mannosyltransferase